MVHTSVLVIPLKRCKTRELGVTCLADRRRDLGGWCDLVLAIEFRNSLVVRA